MLVPEKHRLAAQVMERWADFRESLSSEKRKYPKRQFDVFWSAAKRYAELTKADPLIHRAIAEAVNGLVDFLRGERKRVPAVYSETQRDWSASFSADMTLTSKATNLQVYNPFSLGGSQMNEAGRSFPGRR